MVRKILGVLSLSCALLCSSALAQEPVLSKEEALANDARIYASYYGVDQAEAAARIKAMVASQGLVQNLEEAEGDALLSGYFEHGDTLSYVITSNAPPKKDKKVKFSDAPDAADLAIKYRSSDKVGRGKIRKLFRERNNIIDRLFPEAITVSFDERDGLLAISVPDTLNRSDAAKKERQIENAAGVEVELSFAPDTDLTLGMKGGHQLWVPTTYSSTTSYMSRCSLAFPAKSPDNKEGYLSAGHCANGTSWSEPGSNSYQPLTVRDMRDPRGDWAFVYGAPVERLFKAENNAALRRPSGRRTLSTTCEKSGWSVIEDRQEIVVTSDGSSSYCSGASTGTFVCWYGGHYGPGWAERHGTHSTGHTAAGQQCGEVNAKYIRMNYCGPQENLSCDYAWVEVVPKAGRSSFIAGPGDSGSPIFAWDVAFGIMTHASATQGTLRSVDEATGTAQVMWYTPIDEVYRKGYSLLY